MQTYLVHKSCFTKTRFPYKWTRRPTSLPQLSHGQQILDVIAKQLIEELLAVVVGLQGPGARGHPLNGLFTLGLADGSAASLRHILGIFAVGRHGLVGVLGAEQLIKQVLGPDDAVDGLGRRVADGAAGKGLGRRLRQAVVALGRALPDQRHLAEVAGAAALDERHVRRQTQAVDVAARRLVVEGVEDELELLEVVDAVFGT